MLKSYKTYEEIVALEEHKSLEGYTSCSKLPYLEKCSYFQDAEKGDGAASLKGNILHYILEKHLPELIEDGFIVQPADFPDEEWKKLMFIIKEVAEMVGEGWTILKQEKFYTDDELKICGTVDLILYHEKQDIFAILDFKTGKIIVDTSSAQIAGYGHMVMKESGYTQVFGGVIQEANRILPVSLERDTNEARLKSILNEKRTSVSDNCQYCKHLGVCPTVTKLQEKFMNTEVSKETLSELRDAVPVLDKRIKEIKRLAVEHIDMLDGYKITQKTTRSVNPMVVRQVIDEVGLDKLIEDQAISISVTKTDIPSKFILETKGADYTIKSKGGK